MEHLKHFFKQKGLYLACLAVVFAATAAGGAGAAQCLEPCC